LISVRRALCGLWYQEWWVIDAVNLITYITATGPDAYGDRVENLSGRSPGAGSMALSPYRRQLI